MQLQHTKLISFVTQIKIIPNNITLYAQLTRSLVVLLLFLINGKRLELLYTQTDEHHMVHERGSGGGAG